MEYILQFFEGVHEEENRTELIEVYQKAKAYDDTLKTLDKLIDNDERYKEARSNDFVAGMLLAYEKISILMEDYIKESGEQLDEYQWLRELSAPKQDDDQWYTLYESVVK